MCPCSAGADSWLRPARASRRRRSARVASRPPISPARSSSSSSRSRKAAARTRGAGSTRRSYRATFRDNRPSSCATSRAATRSQAPIDLRHAHGPTGFQYSARRPRRSFLFSWTIRASTTTIRIGACSWPTARVVSPTCPRRSASATAPRSRISSTASCSTAARARPRSISCPCSASSCWASTCGRSSA